MSIGCLKTQISRFQAGAARALRNPLPKVPAVAIVVGLSIISGKDILNIIHPSPEERSRLQSGSRRKRLAHSSASVTGQIRRISSIASAIGVVLGTRMRPGDSLLAMNSPKWRAWWTRRRASFHEQIRSQLGFRGEEHPLGYPHQD